MHIARIRVWIFPQGPAKKDLFNLTQRELRTCSASLHDRLVPVTGQGEFTSKHGDFTSKKCDFTGKHRGTMP